MVKHKNMIKVTVLFLLTAFLSANSFFAVYADSDYSDEIALLKLLDIADSELDEDSFVADAEVLRAEFAQYIARFLNVKGYGSGELYYNDIPKTHYAFDEITSLTDMGYLTGEGDKVFNPEGKIKTEYVYPIFAKAIGAGTIMKDSRDFQTARRICLDRGVLDGVSGSGAYLSLGDLYKMMYNTLTAECYGYDASTGTITKTDDSFLYVTRKMEYVKKGLVTAVGFSDINGENNDEDIVIIDGNEYDLPDFDISAYLGRSVSFIYEEYSKTDDLKGRIINISPRRSGDVLEIEVDPECIYDKESGVLRYFDDNGREKKVTVPNDITLIYNGRFKGSGISQVFEKSRYFLRLIKSGNSDYNIAIVEAYKNITVDYINASEYEVYGKENGEKISLDPDEYESFILTDNSGNRYSFEDIKQNDVISLFASDDNKYLKAVISRDTAAGSVGALYDGKVVIDETEYEMYEGSFTGSLSDDITLYLDMKGYIAYYEAGKTKGRTVGFMIRCAYDEENEQLVFKILNENGIIASYSSAEKITVNKVPFKNDPKGGYDLLRDGMTKVIPQIVSYKLNDEKITHIDTASEDDGADHPLIIDNKAVPINGETDVSQYAYFTVGSGRLGKFMAISGNTKVFYIPEGNDSSQIEEKNCSVGKMNKEGKYPGAISYRTKKNADFFEEYIVIRQKKVSDDMTKYGNMFDTAFWEIDDDNMPIERIRLVTDQGNTMEFYVDPDLDFDSFGFKRGDILNYSLNESNGYIAAIETIYKREKNLFSSKGELTSEFRVGTGYLHDMAPEGFSVGYESGEALDEIFNMATPGVTQVVYYDIKTDKVVVGDYSDLKPYTRYGGNCSKVIFGTWYTALRAIFGYR